MKKATIKKIGTIDENGWPSGGWEFDGGDILRPDFAWPLNDADMLAWIAAWNAAFGASISTATSSQTFAQRWSAYYTSIPTAAWNQISAKAA